MAASLQGFWQNISRGLILSISISPSPNLPALCSPLPPMVCSNQSHLRTGDGPCASQEKGTQFPWLVSNPPKLHSMSYTHPVGASLGEAASTPSSQRFLSSFLSANKILLLPFPSRFPPRAVFPSTNPGPAQAAAGFHPCRQLGKGTTTMESQSQQVGTQPRRAQAFAVHEFIAASRNQHQPSKLC